jgi:alpha-L-rhamnosidase
MRRRTSFVWLPGQRIDHAAGFATLRGAPLRREEEGTNRWVLARGRFRLPRASGGVEIALTVDGRYRAWIDGRPLGRGPVRSSPHFQRYDAYLVQAGDGDRLLAVLVHVPGVDLAWYETVKGAWQPVFGDGGLFCEIVHGGETVPVVWRIEESQAWRRDAAREGWGQDFIEDFDAGAFDPRWIEPDFDDSGWSDARPMVSLGALDEQARGFGRVEPFPALTQSEIPPAATREILPSRLLWTRLAEPRPDLPVEERLYSEALDGDASACVTDIEALLGGDEPTLVRTPPARDVSLMLAFDTYHSGHPFIEVEAKGGEVVELAVAEAVPGEFGRGDAGDGLRPEGHLGVSRIFRYTARPGRQRFEKFNWAAVRAMQVTVRNAPDGLAIRRVGSVSTRYPAVAEGAFECSDPLLNRLWEVGRHTVNECMHDAWVDCPGREARQWVGDAVVQFDVAARAFGPSVYPLQRQFLRQAAEGQRQDGLVRMFAPGDIAADALVIPDFTLLWIIAAERYYRQSADLDTIDAILPSVERALAWFERHSNARGLLADVPHWHFIEWANLGRRGEAAAINALYAGALQSVAILAGATGRERLARRCGDRAQAVAAGLNARHWDSARGVYLDSVDAHSGEQERRVSQHANGLMVLFGLAPEARQAALLRAITDPARLKLTAAPPIVPEGPPFDEETDIVRANTFFSHFVYDGLARGGALRWALDDIRRLYGPMLETGTTTLWESFSPAASLCHGFSATPVYQLSRHLLGISPATPGYETFELCPQPADLAWAKGRVPTPHGPIAVEWWADGERLQVNVEPPSACRLVRPDAKDRRLVREERRESGASFVFGLL